MDRNNNLYMLKNTISGTSLATTWIIIFVSVFVLMLTYSIFYSVIVDIFYNMVVFYDGDVNAANKVRLFFVAFPTFFCFALLVWGVISSFRREQHTYQR